MVPRSAAATAFGNWSKMLHHTPSPHPSSQARPQTNWPKGRAQQGIMMENKVCSLQRGGGQPGFSPGGWGSHASLKVSIPVSCPVGRECRPRNLMWKRSKFSRGSFMGGGFPIQ